jgi:hypothetical protein
VDPAGFTWGVATHVEDVTPEQMQERMAAEKAPAAAGDPAAAAPAGDAAATPPAAAPAG